MLWAWAMHDSGKDAANIVTTKPVLRRFEFPCIIWGTLPESFLDDVASGFDDAIVQPGDRVKGR